MSFKSAHLTSNLTVISSKWMLSITILVIVVMTIIQPIVSIDCFRCFSYNRSSPHCEDPFHNNFSSSILVHSCQSGRKHRDGLFPATSCIKIRGNFKDTGESMIIRDCALDSGSLTADTELARTSNCGAFVFDNRYVIGCVQSCHENACNAASSLNYHNVQFFKHPFTTYFNDICSIIYRLLLTIIFIL